MNPFSDFFKGRRVLVTGHSGFKGAWLSTWLLELGAEVTGYSAYLPSKPCLFEAAGLAKQMRHLEGDIRDASTLRDAFDIAQPEVVFHLAAQPILRASYETPKETFDTNVGGTVNVLECLRGSDVRAAVMITSDKCYQNNEWPWGYRETDPLGGDDPYSASKAAAEIAIRAYVRSFFSDGSGPRIASARAGNVVGGGDWAQGRIVPDCIRAWSEGQTVELRRPEATRPWQHVLEPLSGYLSLAWALSQDRVHGEAFNFGPSELGSHSVRSVVAALATHWEGADWKVVSSDGAHENQLLRLTSEKSHAMLGWRPLLSFEKNMRLTAEWYREFYLGKRDVFGLTTDQVRAYTQTAQAAGVSWAGGRTD